MSPAITSRARAEEFATLVEGDGAPTGDPRRDDLVRLVRAIRDLPPVHPRPEFSASLRERLMAEADTLPATAPGRPRSTTAPAAPRRRDRRVAALVGGFALVGAGTSAAMAAQTALPGDSLYPIKRVVESAELTVVTDDTERGRELLGQAETRLDEVSDLSVRRLPDDARLVAPTLETFTDRATEAAGLLVAAHEQTGAEEPVQLVRDFTRRSMDQLAALGTQVPEDARDELLLAAEAVQAIDSRAGQACPGCAGDVVVVPTELAAAPAEDLVVVAPPEVTVPGDEGRRGDPGDAPDAPDVPDLPDVRPDELPPGSVNDGRAATGPGTGTATEPVDPLRRLTEELTTRAPSRADDPAPGLGGLLQGTTDLVEDTADGLTGGLTDGLDQLDDGLADTTQDLLGDSSGD